MADKKRIVIAWVEMTGLVKTGKMVMRDMNWFPEFVSAPEAKAAVWTNNGTDSDLAAAEKFARQQQEETDRESPMAMRQTFVYALDLSVKNPLDEARKMALIQYAKKAA